MNYDSIVQEFKTELLDFIKNKKPAKRKNKSLATTAVHAGKIKTYLEELDAFVKRKSSTILRANKNNRVLKKMLEDANKDLFDEVKRDLF